MPRLVTRRSAYYNENDPRAAEWLRELIRNRVIPLGDVDERSIHAVSPADLRTYHACHFFAGIGGWAEALRLAGWPADQPVWTGSCPCQPFSSAGRRQGIDDDRHLWPEFARLISECRPPVCIGEQVASKDGRSWLAGVRSDLEGMGYRVGAADLCAAGEGAPHIRQRLYWVADSNVSGRSQTRCNAASRFTSHSPRQTDRSSNASESNRRPHLVGKHPQATGGCTGIGVGDSPSRGRRVCGDAALAGDGGHAIGAGGTGLGGLGYADDSRREGRSVRERGRADEGGVGSAGGPPADPWSDFVLIPCRDGKQRRTQSRIFPLAHGVPGRVGLLRGYGNAIVSQVAAAFLEAYLDVRDGSAGSGRGDFVE